MIKQEAIKAVSKHLDISEEDVRAVVNRFLYECNSALLRGENVKIVEFGTFKIWTHKPKNVFHPLRRKMFRWKGKRTVKFMISRKVEERLNAK